MIIDRDYGPVADWWFEDRNYLASRDSRSDLRHLLEMCQCAAQVLEDHNLLHPSSIILSIWLRFDPISKTLTRVEEPNVTITIPQGKNAKDLLECCEETLNHLEAQRPFLYPVDIEILGTGIILDSSGQKTELADVIWLHGTTLAYHAVDVITQSDVWLPYTLLAEPQPVVSKLNRPRLETALQEIQRRLNITPVWNSSSDYAVIEQYHLSNHTDADGEVVAMYPESELVTEQ